MSKSKSAQQESIISYKGFDKNLQCRGFQYEIGKTYKHYGDVQACSSGFHACEYPLDVFGYYSPSHNRFAVVEQSGKLDKRDEGSKVASSAISITAEITIAELIKAAIEYTTKRCNPIDKQSPSSATGNQGASSATGKASVAITTGTDGMAMAGECGAIVLVYRNDNGDIVHIRASKVGENGIKPNVWYSLNQNGDFVEQL